jgi:hypothetical protein
VWPVRGPVRGGPSVCLAGATAPCGPSEWAVPCGPSVCPCGPSEVVRPCARVARPWARPWWPVRVPVWPVRGPVRGGPSVCLAGATAPCGPPKWPPVCPPPCLSEAIFPAQMFHRFNALSECFIALLLSSTSGALLLTRHILDCIARILHRIPEMRRMLHSISAIGACFIPKWRSTAWFMPFRRRAVIPLYCYPHCKKAMKHASGEWGGTQPIASEV